MRIRTLEPSDVELFYSFRLRGLRESPEAFGSTFAEESVMSAGVRRSRFHCTDENFVLGAFGEDSQLIGVAGFYRATQDVVSPRQLQRQYVWQPAHKY